MEDTHTHTHTKRRSRAYERDGSAGN